jgi:DNA topoisomerase III
MADQIVITEKTSQAKDIRAAVGSRYGDILPAEGHLFDLLEPEDVVPAWKHWSPILLRPEGLHGTRPAEGGNKAAKLKAIREALRSVQRVWLATDCDREGQLIGQEILEKLTDSAIIKVAEGGSLRSGNRLRWLAASPRGR